MGRQVVTGRVSVAQGCETRIPSRLTSRTWDKPLLPLVLYLVDKVMVEMGMGMGMGWYTQERVGCDKGGR